MKYKKVNGFEFKTIRMPDFVISKQVMLLFFLIVMRFILFIAKYSAKVN